MDDIKTLLAKVANGEITPEEAELRLKMKPFEDLGFAKPDTHRALRQGTAEVIFGEGKTPEQISGIADGLLKTGQETVIITRLSEEKSKLVTTPLTYYKEARIGVCGNIPEPEMTEHENEGTERRSCSRDTVLFAVFVCFTASRNAAYPVKWLRCTAYPVE